MGPSTRLSLRKVKKCNSERRNRCYATSIKCDDKLRNNQFTLIRWMNGRNERGGRNVNEKGKGQCPRAGCLMLARAEFRFRTHPCVSTCSEPRFRWLFLKSMCTTYPQAANFSSNPKLFEIRISGKIRMHELNSGIICDLFPFVTNPDNITTLQVVG